MKKNRVLAVVLPLVTAVIIPLCLVLISNGNINKAKKQNDIFDENFTELAVITNEITAEYRANGMPAVLNLVRENKKRAETAVNALRGVCDYFENVKVPTVLKDKRDKVVSAAPAMRNFLDRYENMFHEVMLETEFKAFVSEMSSTADSIEDFILYEQEFMREVERLNHRRGGLIWL